MQIEQVIDGTRCPVCGAGKFSHEQYCRDCGEQAQTVEARKRQAARDRAFGSLWPRER